MLEVSTGYYVLLSLGFIITPHIMSRFFEGSFIYHILCNCIVYPLLIFVTWDMFAYEGELKIISISGNREVNEIIGFFSFILMVFSSVIATYKDAKKMQAKRFK